MQEADNLNDPSEVRQGLLARRGNLVTAGGSQCQGMCADGPGKPIRHKPDVARDQGGVLPILADVEHLSLGFPFQHQLLLRSVCASGS